MGAASSLLNTSLRRPVKYHATKLPTIRITTARAGAIRGGCRLGRVTGDSVVGPVTWARRKRGFEGTRIMVSATGSMLLHLWRTVRQLLHILQNCGHGAAHIGVIRQKCSRFRAGHVKITL